MRLSNKTHTQRNRILAHSQSAVISGKYMHSHNTDISSHPPSYTFHNSVMFVMFLIQRGLESENTLDIALGLMFQWNAGRLQHLQRY